MTDMEKVIKGLECCIIRNPDDKPRCDECPYKYPIKCNCLNRLKIDALALLKKPEKQNKPKNPNQKLPCVCGRQRLRTSYLYHIGTYTIECPACRRSVHGDSEKEVIENWNRIVKINGTNST